jgi:hypothetical protein
MNSGAPALRVAGISMPSTAVTGPITNAQYVAANLTRRLSDENLIATIANVNNTVGV